MHNMHEYLLIENTINVLAFQHQFPGQRIQIIYYPS